MRSGLCMCLWCRVICNSHPHIGIVIVVVPIKFITCYASLLVLITPLLNTKPIQFSSYVCVYVSLFKQILHDKFLCLDIYIIRVLLFFPLSSRRVFSISRMLLTSMVTYESNFASITNQHTHTTCTI